MVRLLLFFKKIHVVLLFVVLEIICLVIFFGQNPYQKARMVAMSNVMVGSVHSQISGVSNYFALAQRNEALLEENARLRSQLSGYLVDSVPAMDSLKMTYQVVRVVRNTYTFRDNFITIAAGTRQGIRPDMALFNMDGIVGYVLYCTEQYSVAMSVLNHSDFSTSGQIRGTNFKGSITWDGNSYFKLQFDDVPKYAKLAIGDTIETTQASRIFPEGLPIGVVENFEIVNGSFYTVNLKMLADMSQLDYLYAVLLKDQKERASVESMIPEEM